MSIDNRVPTPIIDKNGRATIVHKNPENPNLADIKSRIPTVVPPVAQQPDVFDDEPEGADRASLPVQEYKIVPESFDRLKHIIQKANSKLERAGIEERFEYTFSTKTEQDDDGSYKEVLYVTINKPVIKFNGWEFTATHEFTPAGEVLSYWSKEGEYPQPEDAHCDHCGTNRRRERVYTLKNEDGETKQIGSNCLALFLGVKPHGLWSLNDTSFEEEISELEDVLHRGGGQKLYELDTLIKTALLVSNNGEDFVPKSRSSFQNPSTADKVSDKMFHIDEEILKGVSDDVVNEVIEFVRNSSPDDGSDYMANLRAAFKEAEDGPTLVKRKHLGIAVSAVSAWYRDKHKVDAETGSGGTNIPIKQEWYGTKGERFKKSIPLTVRKRLSFDGEYGTTHMFIMNDPEGRIFKWSASNPPDVFEGGNFVIEAASVKDHVVYEGNHQTVITRPKVGDVQNYGKVPFWKASELLREAVEDLPREEKLKIFDEYDAIESLDAQLQYLTDRYGITF